MGQKKVNSIFLQISFEPYIGDTAGQSSLLHGAGDIPRSSFYPKPIFWGDSQPCVGPPAQVRTRLERVRPFDDVSFAMHVPSKEKPDPARILQTVANAKAFQLVLSSQMHRIFTSSKDSPDGSGLHTTLAPAGQVGALEHFPALQRQQKASTSSPLCSGSSKFRPLTRENTKTAAGVPSQEQFNLVRWLHSAGEGACKAGVQFALLMIRKFTASKAVPEAPQAAETPTDLARLKLLARELLQELRIEGVLGGVDISILVGPTVQFMNYLHTVRSLSCCRTPSA